MKSTVRVALNTSPEQFARLLALQREFARACNALAPVVQETRIWNRVALHHMAYRKLRQQFPGMGSQMACNAIYSVSRACRLVFQSAGSPFHMTQLEGKPLPRLHFLDNSPVYFDRHTLSIKQGQASLYTLDGRMRFQLALRPEQEAAFHERRLLEASLLRAGDHFELRFSFGPAAGAVDAPVNAQSSDAALLAVEAAADDVQGQLEHVSAVEQSSSVAGTGPAEQPVRALPPYISVEQPA